MSLCKSTPNDDIPDVSTDELPESKSLKTSKPSNSTFLDEHLNVEFKDIIFEARFEKKKGNWEMAYFLFQQRGSLETKPFLKELEAAPLPFDNVILLYTN